MKQQSKQASAKTEPEPAAEQAPYPLLPLAFRRWIQAEEDWFTWRSDHIEDEPGRGFQHFDMGEGPDGALVLIDTERFGENTQDITPEEAWWYIWHRWLPPVLRQRLPLGLIKAGKEGGQ